MSRVLILSYGVVAYAAFLATFVYLVGFVSGVAVPRTIDDPPASELPWALAIDTGLLLLFALQHNIMARRRFKRWLTRLVPPAAERSTFVLATCAVLVLLFVEWRAAPGVVWDVDHAAGRIALWTLCCFGWLLALVTTFLIDHFELFGLEQSICGYRGLDTPAPAFIISAFYQYVRHPLMLGFIIAIWATPRMTVGHLYFAAFVTLWILVSIPLEERGLVETHGSSYLRYRSRVPALFPLGRKRGRRASAAREAADTASLRAAGDSTGELAGRDQRGVQ